MLLFILIDDIVQINETLYVEVFYSCIHNNHYPFLCPGRFCCFPPLHFHIFMCCITSSISIIWLFIHSIMIILSEFLFKYIMYIPRVIYIQFFLLLYTNIIFLLFDYRSLNKFLFLFFSNFINLKNKFIKHKTYRLSVWFVFICRCQIDYFCYSHDTTCIFLYFFLDGENIRNMLDCILMYNKYNYYYS